MTVDWLRRPGDRPQPGPDFETLLARKGSLAVAGCYDGLSGLLAKQAGFEALYLSGAALSASMALPDLGLITMEEVMHCARTVQRATGLPMIVDCDTGFGEALNVMRAVRELEAAGVACMQIEDQVFPKKCGHLNDKLLATADDMCRKIAAAKSASETLKVCARTDARMISIEEAIARARQYVDAGADIIFVEAMTSDEEIAKVREAISVPLLGNMTEFGRTPQIPMARWEELGVDLVIFPVSALRVVARTLEDFYKALKQNGDVSEHLEQMMTRRELYDLIRYFDYEKMDDSIAASVLDT